MITCGGYACAAAVLCLAPAGAVLGLRSTGAMLCSAALCCAVLLDLLLLRRLFHTFTWAIMLQARATTQHITCQHKVNSLRALSLFLMLIASCQACDVRCSSSPPADESDQENTTAVAAFGQVVAYCVTESCRRALVLGHFGEALPQGACTGCDCCQQPEAVRAQVGLGLRIC